MKVYYDKSIRPPIILENDIYLGFEYYILSMGSHPCCYVLLPEGHKYHGLFYEEIPIKCHYGLTYTEKYLMKDNVALNGEWVIGWDYAHVDDYLSFGVPFVEGDEYGKKWTIEELRDEVHKVIEQL